MCDKVLKNIILIVSIRLSLKSFCGKLVAKIMQDLARSCEIMQPICYRKTVSYLIEKMREFRKSKNIHAQCELCQITHF